MDRHSDVNGGDGSDYDSNDDGGGWLQTLANGRHWRPIPNYDFQKVTRSKISLEVCEALAEVIAYVGIYGGLEQHPPGYPRYSALLSANDHFFIARRFTKIRARILLLKQDKLSMLEERIETIDRDERCPLFLGKSRCDRNTERIDTLAEFEERLADYDRFLEQTHRMLSFNPAQPRDIRSLQNWLKGNVTLARDESEYLSYRNDLLSLASTKDDAMTKLEAWVEDGLAAWNPTLLSRASRSLSSDPNVFVSTASPVGKVTKGIVLGIMILLLLLPIVVCNCTTSLTARMSVVMMFVIIYLGILLHMTRSRTIEILVAGATYATVLIVFVSNSSFDRSLTSCSNQEVHFIIDGDRPLVNDYGDLKPEFELGDRVMIITSGTEEGPYLIQGGESGKYKLCDDYGNTVRNGQEYSKGDLKPYKPFG
ncbi:hypothetical protein QBC36DRAFT_311121 [Triangularia setosa]|uniref:DUF6594 domain-containing protein n=1 Tax=Triangularia setosa TaxID=2587417 RepID=A0AAN6W769_9PEZI|nr:hypothetical protein QBC36DRAFT_311121 [Podospora setosa]